MEVTMKKLLTSLIVLAMICCICLTSCTPISRNDAEAMLKDFFTAITADDYETAVSYMHPINNLDADGLRDAIEKIEGQVLCDFSNGLELGSCISYYTSVNLNSNGISGLYTTLALQHEIRIGNQDVRLESSFVNDSDGLSISGFKIIATVSDLNNKV